MCNGDNTFAVCMKGEVSVTQVCAGNAICCTKTNSCDFRARCDGLDVPYTPPDKCYGVLDGFSICSDNLTQVLTCQANAIANAASCPEVRLVAARLHVARLLEHAPMYVLVNLKDNWLVSAPTNLLSALTDWLDPPSLPALEEPFAAKPRMDALGPESVILNDSLLVFNFFFL
ncbi:hypothetical protein BC829DRAFT_41926 [Chytridium lagenaria]|nr:hypothetical protein BC829DRAFT_41926 [Chytridium lagenaria]